MKRLGIGQTLMILSGCVLFSLLIGLSFQKMNELACFMFQVLIAEVAMIYFIVFKVFEYCIFLSMILMLCGTRLLYWPAFCLLEQKLKNSPGVFSLVSPTTSVNLVCRFCCNFFADTALMQPCWLLLSVRANWLEFQSVSSPMLLSLFISCQ